MMDNKEQALRKEFGELEAKLQDPAIFSDPSYPKLAKRRSELEGILALFDKRQKLARDKASAEELQRGDDAELQQMAAAELQETAVKMQANEEKLIEALTPQ